MLVFSVILGVLLICGGFSFIFTPLASLMSIGYFIIILFFIAGIYNIIRGIREKSYGPDFIFGLISVVLGIILLFIPDATPSAVASDAAVIGSTFILYVAAGWFMLKGILTIVGSINAKKLGAGTGTIVCGVILGLLEIGLTAYSIVHPLVLAVAIAWLLGFYFIVTGINIMTIGGMIDRVKNTIDGAESGAGSTDK